MFFFLLCCFFLKVIGGELQERLIPVPYSKSSTDQAVSRFLFSMLASYFYRFPLFFYRQEKKLLLRSTSVHTLLFLSLLCVLNCLHFFCIIFCLHSVCCDRKARTYYFLMFMLCFSLVVAWFDALSVFGSCAISFIVRLLFFLRCQTNSIVSLVFMFVVAAHFSSLQFA